MFSDDTEKITYKSEKIAALFKNQEWSDCYFIFGAEKIGAHKIILTCSSSIFELMFYGPMSATEIEISDIDIGDFKQMLEFVYTNNINIKSVTNAWALIYISKKYFINDLLDVCVHYIKNNLSLSNLVLCYEYSELYNQKVLAKICWKDIVIYTKGILKGDYHMKSSTLCSILREQMNAENEELITAAFKWAAEECILRNLEPSVDNTQQMLTDTGIYQRLSVIMNFDEDECDIHRLGSKVVLRKTHQKTPFNMTFHYRDSYKIERSILLHPKNEIKSEISTNMDIFIYGIALATKHRPADARLDRYMEHVRIKMFLVNNTQLVELMDFQDCDDVVEYDSILLTCFNDPVFMEAEKRYRITVEYFCDPAENRNEVVAYYLNNAVSSNKSKVTFKFTNEVVGSVVRGVSYYIA